MYFCYVCDRSTAWMNTRVVYERRRVGELAYCYDHHPSRYPLDWGAAKRQIAFNSRTGHNNGHRDKVEVVGGGDGSNVCSAFRHSDPVPR